MIINLKTFLPFLNDDEDEGKKTWSFLEVCHLGFLLGGKVAPIEFRSRIPSFTLDYGELSDRASAANPQIDELSVNNIMS